MLVDGRRTVHEVWAVWLRPAWTCAVDILKMIPIDVTAGEATLK